MSAEIRPLGRFAAEGWHLSRFFIRMSGAAVGRAGRFAGVRMAARMGISGELAGAVFRSRFEAALRSAKERADTAAAEPDRTRRAAVTRVNGEKG